jgi:hypothetical protein
MSWPDLSQLMWPDITSSGTKTVPSMIFKKSVELNILSQAVVPIRTNKIKIQQKSGIMEANKMS